MKLANALKYMDLSKSTFYYKFQIKEIDKKRYQFDQELKEILLNLTGYKLTLGYRKLTKYLRNKYLKIWNKKKIYAYMKTLNLLQPKNIKRQFIKNRRLIVCCPIKSNVDLP